jgi:hypothetical protein
MNLTSQYQGEGVIKGEMLAKPVRILAIRRAPALAPPAAPSPASPAAAAT